MQNFKLKIPKLFYIFCQENISKSFELNIKVEYCDLQFIQTVGCWGELYTPYCLKPLLKLYN